MLWEKNGPQNTENTVAAALKRGNDLGIKYLVVASNSGRTAQHFLNKNFTVICVSHHVGFSQPGEGELDPAIRQELSDKGARVLVTTHLLAGIDRALQQQWGGIYPTGIIAASLRILGQGIKVCVEISTMALDAGLVPFGEEIITVAGSGRGADTACVVLPAHSNRFFETVVKEIICMPREK